MWCIFSWVNFWVCHYCFSSKKDNYLFSFSFLNLCVRRVHSCRNNSSSTKVSGVESACSLAQLFPVSWGGSPAGTWSFRPLVCSRACAAEHSPVNGAVSFFCLYTGSVMDCSISAPASFLFLMSGQHLLTWECPYDQQPCSEHALQIRVYVSVPP